MFTDVLIFSNSVIYIIVISAETFLIQNLLISYRSKIIFLNVFFSCDLLINQIMYYIVICKYISLNKSIADLSNPIIIIILEINKSFTNI